MASVKTTRIIAVVSGIAVIAAVVLVAWLATPGPSGADVLQVVPRDAGWVVHVRDAGRLVTRLEDVAARLGQASRTGALRQSLQRQLGFDPTDPEALSERGLDPQGGVALFEAAGAPGDPLAAFVVTDRGRFEQAFLALVESRAGAKRGEPILVEELQIERAFDQRDRLLTAWAYEGDVVVFTGGPNAPERLAATLAAARKGSVVEDLWFGRARAAAGEGADLFGYVAGDRAGRASRALTGRIDALGVGLSVPQDGLRASAYLGLDAPRRLVLEPLPREVDAGRLVARLDPDAVIAARVGIDPQRTWRLLKDAGLPRQLEELQARLVAQGLSLEKDVFGLLQGTAAVDLRLTGDPAGLQGAGNLDPRRTNPFRYVRTSILVPLRDPARAREVLPKIAPAIGPAIRARVEQVDIEGQPAWKVTYRLGEGMTFGIVDDLLVITGGEGAFADTRRRLQEGSDGLGRRLSGDLLRVLAEEGAAAVVIQVDALLQTAQEAAERAFGGGPDGLMLKSMVRQLTAPLSRVEQVSGVLERHESGLVVRVDLGLEPQEGGE